MTKKELFEALKDVRDDEEILLSDEQDNTTCEIGAVERQEDGVFIIAEPIPKL